MEEAKSLAVAKYANLLTAEAQKDGVPLVVILEAVKIVEQIYQSNATLNNT